MFVTVLAQHAVGHKTPILTENPAIEEIQSQMRALPGNRNVHMLELSGKSEFPLLLCFCNDDAQYCVHVQHDQLRFSGAVKEVAGEEANEEVWMTFDNGEVSPMPSKHVVDQDIAIEAVTQFSIDGSLSNAVRWEP